MAPKSAFRKRNTKMIYDKNEFHMFRLPSEDSFLLSGFDKDEIFGLRKGVSHSPHIKAQTELDSNMVWGISLFMLGLAMWEMKGHQQLKTLRENYRNSDEGKYSITSFK